MNSPCSRNTSTAPPSGARSLALSSPVRLPFTPSLSQRLTGSFCNAGKYNSGQIPADSRYARNASISFIKERADQLSTPEGQARIAKVVALEEIAKELGATTAQLALAWTAKNENVSTLIIGASKPEQVVENLGALDIIPKITDEIYVKIDKIFALEA